VHGLTRSSPHWRALNKRRRPNGTTDVDVVVVREGKNLKGRVLSGVLGTIGKRSLGKAFANSVKAIEARRDARVVESS
jgi:hypothetical protein